LDLVGSRLVECDFALIPMGILRFEMEGKTLVVGIIYK
jgi:hypothetical protein